MNAEIATKFTASINPATGERPNRFPSAQNIYAKCSLVGRTKGRPVHDRFHVSRYLNAVDRAWNRKELFKEFRSHDSREQAEQCFKRRCFSATPSRCRPVIEVAER